MQTRSCKGFPILAVLMLSACGGGGGESATPLSSWTPSSKVIANGKGQEVTFDYDPATKQVGTITPPSAVLGNYSTELTLDAGELTALTLTTPTGTKLTFNTTYKLDAATWGATNFNSSAVVANPFNLGWDYQSFGVWQTGLDSTTGTFGAFSVGTPTAGMDIPVTGTTTFIGKLAGSYVSGGLGHAVLADLSVNVDFGSSRSLVFSTSNTRISTDWVTFDTASGLNLTNPTLNTLKYESGTNSFTGTLTTQSGLSGNSTGQFYGPAAQELGGVFFLQGNGETYTGAYGAKK